MSGGDEDSLRVRDWRDFGGGGFGCPEAEGLAYFM